MGVAGCPGIPDRIKSVQVAGYYRYRWPDHPGIRNYLRIVVHVVKADFDQMQEVVQVLALLFCHRIQNKLNPPL